MLFGPPGRAYVYLSYGIHSLLNFVAEPEGEAAAVLIRALEPTAGLEADARARRGERTRPDLCSGPGKLTEALGVGLERQRRRPHPDPFLLLAPEDGDRRGGRHRARGSGSRKPSSAPGASAPPAVRSSRVPGRTRGPALSTVAIAGSAGGDAAAGRRRFRAPARVPLPALLRASLPFRRDFGFGAGFVPTSSGRPLRFPGGT